jgi:hypothetical protein
LVVKEQDWKFGSIPLGQRGKVWETGVKVSLRARAFYIEVETSVLWSKCSRVAVASLAKYLIGIIPQGEVPTERVACINLVVARCMPPSDVRILTQSRINSGEIRLTSSATLPYFFTYLPSSLAQPTIAANASTVFILTTHS